MKIVTVQVDLLTFRQFLKKTADEAIDVLTKSHVKPRTYLAIENSDPVYGLKLEGIKCASPSAAHCLHPLSL